jgi:hypothetical protein
MVVCWPPRPLLAAVELEEDKKNAFQIIEKISDTYTKTSSVNGENFAVI